MLTILSYAKISEENLLYFTDYVRSGRYYSSLKSFHLTEKKLVDQSYESSEWSSGEFIPS